MEKVASLERQVRRNCTISDARFAGLYSVCGLAMRLRDLYKWEHSLPPYEEHEAGRVLDWIGRKETAWEQLQDTGFHDLEIAGERLDPFQTGPINRLIAPLNLFYGAGYAQGLKPTFLLAEIADRQVVSGHEVIWLAAEKARDLLTLPAFTQNGRVLVRQSAAELYLWDQLLYMNRSGRPFFRYALRASGLSETEADLRNCLPVVIEAQRDAFVFHEIGELTDTAFDPAIWRAILAALPHSATEFLVRAVKDMLADTNPRGNLPRMVRMRRQAALGFYAAFHDGLGKSLFPEIRQAIARFMGDGDWETVAKGIRAVHRKAQDMARTIGALYAEALQRDDMAWMAGEVERRYIHPSMR